MAEPGHGEHETQGFREPRSAGVTPRQARPRKRILPAAESAMANEFRFEDHPDAVKFTPVTDEAIRELAAQYGLEFSREYLAFLKAHNGVNSDRLSKAAPLAPGIETFDSIGYLYGVDTGFQYNDLRAYLTIPGVWDNPFRAFAYPVGEGAGGDPIIQIFKGSNKGKVYFVDHEVFPDVSELEDEGIDVENPDAALAFMIDVQGCFIEVAKSFSQFVDKLVVYDEDGRTQIGIRRPLS
jgi:SMI1 / KNR4 family (SUKH-1)